jgi:hypothetical protein
MMITGLRPLLLAGAVLAGVVAVPAAAQADWRGRGHGWGPAARHWAPPPPPRVYHHHHRGSNAAPLLGAIIGLGVGLALGSALNAPPPPPPVYYQPPPGPPPGYYHPPAPPTYSHPPSAPPGYYQPPAMHHAPPMADQPGSFLGPAKSRW